MTCKVCRREEYGDECGPKGKDECPCCGMVIIAEAGDELDEIIDEVELREEG